VSGGYYPRGRFIDRRSADTEFEIAREDFLLEYRERTARAYKADLDDYYEWCSGHGARPLNPTSEDVAAYLTDLEERGYSKGTTARKKAALRGFLINLIRKGVLGSSPMHHR
jgi:integrase/recombinase XerC